jgi:cytochrome c biogenesis protein CcdA
MKYELTVPTDVVGISKVIQAHWVIALGVFLVAVLASIVVEVIKRKYNAKQQADMAKKTVGWLLVTFTTLFTILGYGVFFLQANQNFLQTLPFVGQHVIEALGVAYTLYNLRLNKWYTNFALWASKWTNTKASIPATTTAAPAPVAPTVVEPVADFSS